MLRLLSPEILLLTVAVAIYTIGAFIDCTRLWRRMAAGGIVLAGVALAAAGGQSLHAGSLAIDPLAYFFRWLALAAGLSLVLISPKAVDPRGLAEYTGSLLLTVPGLMLTAAANDLIMLFVSLELISIPTYVVLYLGRYEPGSREATAKYFFLSILSSALLLYGFSFLYGAAGSTALEAIRARLSDPASIAQGPGPLVKVALVMLFAGLGFRMAAVPFHYYAPDVYQGTSHTNAAFLSVLPKAAGVVVLVRLVVMAMPHLEPFGWRLAAAMAVLTMTLGNVVALWQDNLRRLLAYSSIAHAGYMLVGLAVALAGARAAGQWDGVAAMLFYLCVYAVATIGLFAALVYLGRIRQQLDGIDELAGLSRTRPWMAAAIALFLFSLTGLPPLAGFWGKLAVFGSALAVDAGGALAGSTQAWFIFLAVAGVLNSAVSAAYYLRIVGLMYFRTPLATPRAEGGNGSALVTALCAVLVVLLGMYTGPLVRQAMQASPLPSVEKGGGGISWSVVSSQWSVVSGQWSVKRR
jgi:NADH-quinone oxidoreductase subunit N